MKKAKYISLLGFTCLTLAGVGAIASQPDWVQTGIGGKDVSVSHDGKRYLVGENGKAYIFENENWQAFGSRSDFGRIDAGKNWVAALTESGALYFSKNKSWQPTGMRASDLGIGGNTIWLADAQLKDGNRGILTGEITTDGKIDWQKIEGRLSRIDVDPQGRAWGVSTSGKVYVYANSTWIEDTKAPSASDIGVGEDGSIYITGLEQNANLGGGRVFQRDPNSGEYTEMQGRLNAVSVTPDGKAFGVNTLNWVIAGNMEAAEQAENPSDPTSLEPPSPPTEENNQEIIGEGDKTLADIVGDKIPGANKVKLSKFRVTENSLEGWVELNGSPVHAALYAPVDGSPPVIGLEHESIDLATYIAKIRENNLGSFGLGNAIFFMLSDQFEAVTYQAVEDVPEVLSGLLGTGEYNGLFPLELKPGVTVIGTYAPSTDGNAATVMKAFGIDEKGYAVKGHFRLEQLKNPKLNWSTQTSEARKNLTVDKNEVCNAIAENAPISGLNLSFALSDFKPPYAQGIAEFSGTEFLLKEVDGEIEPSIVTGLTLKLPEAQAGIKDIEMAGKLAAKGNLNVVCNGISTQTEGTISFAGSTALNATKIEEIAFTALEKPGEEKPGENETSKDIGWKNPFFIPELTIRSFASSGEFQQKEEEGKLKRTLSSQIWANSKLDRADIDLYGSIDVEIHADTKTSEITDWSFNAPGPIALNDLPGLKDVPKVDEFIFKDITLTPTEMTGTLGWPAQKMEMDGYLALQEQENTDPLSQLFIRFNTLKPATLASYFPDFIDSADITPALLGFSTRPTVEWKISDAPEALSPFFSGLLKDDDSITVPFGVTLAGQVDPAKIMSGKYGDIFTKYLGLGNELTLIGALENDGVGNFTGEVRAMLNKISLAGIPETLLEFKDSELVLSNLGGSKVEIETSADLKIPGKTKPFDLIGKIAFEAESSTKNELTVELSSSHEWNEPLDIPSLTISNLGLEATLSKDGNNEKKEVALVGDGEFRKQQGEVKVSFRDDGSLFDALVSFEGSMKLSQLLDLPQGAGDIADADFKQILIATNAIAGDVTVKLGGKEISGRGVVIRDGEDYALFIRNDNQVSLGDITKDIGFPMDEVTMPKGVFVISDKDVSDFDAGDIPDAIYDEIFLDLVDDDMLANLKVEEGLMFLTKLDVKALPSFMKTVLKTPFGLQDEIFVAGSIGGIFGGPTSAAFYTVLKNVTPDYPDFVKEFIEMKNANLQLFVRAAGANSVDIGVAADAFIKPRRLDDPSIVQKLDGTFELVYNASETGTSFMGGATVNGDWVDPLGLDGYRLKNSGFRFGVEEKGITLEINSEEARFKDFAEDDALTLDLATTWAGGVPTDLAVQFSKTIQTNELVLTPITLAQLQKSIFDLAFRSGSKLSDSVLSKLNGDMASRMADFSSKLSSASDGMFSLIEKSPLGFIGVRNPYLYFGTPGSKPPNNPNIDPPPLGLGLHVDGDFILNAGAFDADLASGTYKVNLADGYYFEGEITPPSPFAQNNLTVSGNMPILGSAQGISLSGSLDNSALSLIPGLPFSISGSFGMSRGTMFDKTANINANINIGSLIDRQGNITLNGSRITASSPAECDDIPPLAINLDMDLSNFSPQTMVQSMIEGFVPGIPDPIECAGDIAGKFKEIAEKGLDAIKDPEGLAEEVGEGIVNVFKDPEEAAREVTKKAEQLAKLPMNTAETLSDFGINLATAGLEKVPVLGPGAGKAVGEAYDKAKELKNFAMDKLRNNAATAWMSDSFGMAAGAIGGFVGDATGAVGDFFGGSSSSPTWYRINPLRCKSGMHHWNPIFTQCFENGAVVLFDESSRGANKLGDCIRYVHDNSEVQLWVDKCHGDAFNQFHLDPVSNEIRATKQSYWGYNGRWHGPWRSDCMIKNSKGTISLGRCGGDNAKWTYTEDMRLQQGNTCIHRGADNKLGMNLCSDSTQWLGTSVAPNWNEVHEIPIRGRISHPATGRCLWWEAGGPYALASCGKDNVTDDDKFNMRTHTRLMALDSDHTVAILGARPWDGAVHYACMGLTSNAKGNTAVMARHCWPDTIYEESKWRALAVLNDGKLDVNHTISLKETLKNHDYVFWNAHSQQCLKGSLTKAEADNPNSLGFINETMLCTDGNGYVMADVKFRGYEADNISSWVLIEAEDKAQRQLEAEREKVKPSLQEWQRFRIRQENTRIDANLQATKAFRNNTNKILNERKSPGQCAHNEFWNQAMKRCDENQKMVFHYHNSKGERLGCLRFNPDSNNRLQISKNCKTQNEYDAVIKGVVFNFDDENRIVTSHKSNSPWAVQKNAPLCLASGGSNVDVYGDFVDQPDLNEAIENSEPKTLKLRELTSGYCSSSSGTVNENFKWAYSPTGELVSGGKCLREGRKGTRKYVISEGRKYNDALQAKYKEISDRLHAQYAGELKERLERMAVFRAPLYADGIVSDEEHVAIAREYERLTVELNIDDMERQHGLERAQAQQDLQKNYNFYEDSTVSTLVMADCNSDPMETTKLRWEPSISVDFTDMQGLPKTIKLSPSSDNRQCVTADMRLNGNITMESCANDNKDQYLAVAGVSANYFLISPRNSKTCLFNGGDNKISHRPCNASGAELFVKLDESNGVSKIQNVNSKLCLDVAVNDVVQVPCENAQRFAMNSVESINNLTFEPLANLQTDPEKTASAQALWEKTRQRAIRMYMASYLEQNGQIVAKTDNDTPVFESAELVKLKEWPSHINPVTKKFEVIPAIDVPRSDILALPGFDNGIDRVTFVHAMELFDRTENNTPIRNVDPYKAVYGNWFVHVHKQKAMIVKKDGSLAFEYIEEEEGFRTAATFKVIKVGARDEHKYAFESLLKPGQFLKKQGNALVLGARQDTSTSFDWTSAAKWIKNENLNLITMEPPLRAPRPPFDNWKFPDTETSILNKNY